MGSINKILLTGANGFLGSQILNQLLIEGYHPVVLVRESSNLWRVENILSKCEVFILDEDRSNLKALFESKEIKGVIHTATDYGRGHSLAKILTTNVLFPIEIIEYGIANGLEIFINADTFFGKPQFQQKYLNHYTDSKRILEKLLVTFADRLTVCNIRLEHIYGERDSDSKFVTSIFNQLTDNQSEVLLTEGNQKRDFIYVEDAANAFIQVLKKAERSMKYSEFQVGNGHSISVRSFVEKMAKITGSTSSLKFGALPTRIGDIPDSFADISEIKKIGWEPNHSIEAAIYNMIKNKK